MLKNKMNLQLFAETDESDNKDTKDTNEKKDTQDNKEDKVLSITQEELDKIITKRLERERKKADEERAEAERLAKMSAEERAKAEFDKEKQVFEQERKQYQLEKLELQITKELATKNLPVEFASYLMADDADKCMDNIKTFESLWQKALEKAVNSKLTGKTPNAGSGTQSKDTIDPFLKGFMGK